MKLYHGSTIDIAKVDLDLSKTNKDFGRAFYLSDDRQQALEIARYKQGYITFDEFLRRIQYIKGITFQYAFCTQRAIDKLRKL